MDELGIEGGQYRSREELKKKEIEVERNSVGRT